MVKNLRLLANNFELDQSDGKSMQAITSTHKSWYNRVTKLCYCLVEFRFHVFFTSLLILKQNNSQGGSVLKRK